MKGILNKLTPEAFDKLLEQLKAQITSTEILHSAISLVFESAVAQPTFVSMYAELCVRLSKVRPSGLQRVLGLALGGQLQLCVESCRGLQQSPRSHRGTS